MRVERRLQMSVDERDIIKLLVRRKIFELSDESINARFVGEFLLNLLEIDLAFCVVSIGESVLDIDDAEDGLAELFELREPLSLLVLNAVVADHEDGEVGIVGGIESDGVIDGTAEGANARGVINAQSVPRIVTDVAGGALTAFADRVAVAVSKNLHESGFADHGSAVEHDGEILLTPTELFDAVIDGEFELIDLVKLITEDALVGETFVLLLTVGATEILFFVVDSFLKFIEAVTRKLFALLSEFATFDQLLLKIIQNNIPPFIEKKSQYM